MNLLRYKFAAIICCCGVTGSFARAEDKPPANDRDFLLQAMTGGHAEVKYSELAEKHSSNEKVHDFAKRMIDDHTAANKKLAEHAKDQKTAVVAGFERDKRDIYTNLMKLKGDDFDRAYMKQMVEDHEGAVKLFEHETRIAADANLKKFAEETLPTLRDHLKQAKEINEGLIKK